MRSSGLALSASVFTGKDAKPCAGRSMRWEFQSPTPIGIMRSKEGPKLFARPKRKIIVETRSFSRSRSNAGQEFVFV